MFKQVQKTMTLFSVLSLAVTSCSKEENLSKLQEALTNVKGCWATLKFVQDNWETKWSWDEGDTSGIGQPRGKSTNTMVSISTEKKPIGDGPDEYEMGVSFVYYIKQGHFKFPTATFCIKDALKESLGNNLRRIVRIREVVNGVPSKELSPIAFNVYPDFDPEIRLKNNLVIPADGTDWMKAVVNALDDLEGLVVARADLIK